jgi:choline dehydrogenase-like flavoprotein
VSPTAERLEAAHLVIGSGAGGSITAARLAEAGHDVLVTEEGPWVAAEEVQPFGLDQMTRQYRNAGLTAALGRPAIAYAEGCCVGGGTEVNSGLYHRPPGDVLAAWARDWGVRDCAEEDLEGHLAEVEASLSIQPVPAGSAPRASTVLAEGAERLGWHALEVPRWYRYDGAHGVKQSMTRTYLPRAQSAGARILSGARIERLVVKRGRAVGATGTRDGRPLQIAARHVWVCAGAIGSAALLQRSGVRGRVGRTLRMHPTAKLAARFDDDLDAAPDVPMHQVKEFGPDLSFGGSASRPGFVALALSDAWSRNREDVAQWRRMGVYYAAIRSEGHGRVVALPGARDPLVTYRLTRTDLALLRSGLARLALLLLAAGARVLYPSLRDAPQITSPGEIPAIHRAFTRAAASLMTVHLTSTIPFGEDPSRSPVDSWGSLRAFGGVTVNDASLLPDAPGVNPQGTICALASRNVARHLERAA